MLYVKNFNQKSQNEHPEMCTDCASAGGWPRFHLVGGLAQSCGVSVVKRPPSSPSSVWPCCLQGSEGSHPYKDLQSFPKSRPQLTPGHKSKGNSSSSSSKNSFLSQSRLWRPWDLGEWSLKVRRTKVSRNGQLYSVHQTIHTEG